MKSRFSNEQKISVVHQAAAGAQVRELCRMHGLRRRRSAAGGAKYDGIQLAEAKRLRMLEDGNRRLKKLVTDLSLDNAMLKDLVGRRW